MAEFTDKQLDKRVVGQNGSIIGTVADVRRGTLWVTIEPNADHETLKKLRWTGTVNQGTHELKDRFVGDVTPESIRLNV